MSTYALIRFEVTNEEAYANYRSLAAPSVDLHGGSFVAKGPVTHNLEGGDHLTNFALISFPSAEAVTAWYHSAEYSAAREARAGAGEMSVAIIGS